MVLEGVANPQKSNKVAHNYLMKWGFHNQICGFMLPCNMSEEVQQVIRTDMQSYEHLYNGLFGYLVVFIC